MSPCRCSCITTISGYFLTSELCASKDVGLFLNLRRSLANFKSSPVSDVHQSGRKKYQTANTLVRKSCTFGRVPKYRANAMFRASVRSICPGVPTRVVDIHIHPECGLRSPPGQPKQSKYHLPANAIPMRSKMPPVPRSMICRGRSMPLMRRPTNM